jgi:hypothetical protein
MSHVNAENPDLKEAALSLSSDIHVLHFEPRSPGRWMR